MQKPAKPLLNNLPVNIFLITCTSRWLIEGILEKSYLEILGFGLALVLQLIICHTGMKLKLNKKILVVLIYLFSIVSNVLIKSLSTSIIGKAFLQVLIFTFAMIWNIEKIDKLKFLNLFIKLGLFHSILILLHYSLKDKFNALYFPLLNPIDRSYAQAYYRGGRYFGIHDSPHEVAGIVLFAIIVLFIDYIINDKKKTYKLVLIAICTFALLLTGKRGVLVCGIVTIILIVLVLYGSKKQWIRSIVIMLVATMAYFGVRYYIMLHATNPLFFRFARLLNSISDGSIFTINRFKLYSRAVDLWRKNPIMGIGWRKFKIQSIGIHDSLAHEVNLDYLQWLCELGIFGFILNIIFVGIMLMRTIHICRSDFRNIVNKDIRMLTLFAIGIQFFTVLYAFFEIPFYDIYFISIYALSCSVIVAAPKWARKRIVLIE